MIYDCFPFYDELMLLEIRLNELAPFVDKFVLVEAKHTYSGKPKRLYYDEVKDNEVFAPFKHKIVHLIYDGEPTPPPASARMRRCYETSQRNMVELGLSEAGPNDIIIESDVDEIVNPSVFPIIKNILVPCRLEMKLFYYYFNCRASRNWFLPGFCRFKDYKTAQTIRLGNGNGYHKCIVVNAGWHFSYLVPPAKIPMKLASFCHAEYDTDYYKDVGRIQKCVEKNEDIFGRTNMHFSIEPLDAPEYVMNNTEKYRKYIKK